MGRSERRERGYRDVVQEDRSEVKEVSYCDIMQEDGSEGKIRTNRTVSSLIIAPSTIIRRREQMIRVQLLSLSACSEDPREAKDRNEADAASPKIRAKQKIGAKLSALAVVLRVGVLCWE